MEPTFSYLPPEKGGLRQGELLQGVVWHDPGIPVAEVGETFEARLDSLALPTVVILSPDCDLERDLESRDQSVPSKGEWQQAEKERDKKRLWQVTLCPAWDEKTVRRRTNRNPKDARKNEHPRIHRIPPGPIEGTLVERVVESVFDLHDVFGVSTTGLYSAIDAGAVRRIGVVPAVYLQALVQRFFSYQSRIGLPDKP